MEGDLYVQGNEEGRGDENGGNRLGGYMNNEGGEGIDRVGEKDEWLFSGYRFW